MPFEIFQQFFRNDFPTTHIQTTHRDVYKNCLVCETHVRELIVFDVPLQVRPFVRSAVQSARQNAFRLTSRTISSPFSAASPQIIQPNGTMGIRWDCERFRRMSLCSIWPIRKHFWYAEFGVRWLLFWVLHNYKPLSLPILVLPYDARPNSGELLAP